MKKTPWKNGTIWSFFSKYFCCFWTKIWRLYHINFPNCPFNFFSRNTKIVLKIPFFRRTHFFARSVIRTHFFAEFARSVIKTSKSERPYKMTSLYLKTPSDELFAIFQSKSWHINGWDTYLAKIFTFIENKINVLFGIKIFSRCIYFFAIFLLCFNAILIKWHFITLVKHQLCEF